MAALEVRVLFVEDGAADASREPELEGGVPGAATTVAPPRVGGSSEKTPGVNDPRRSSAGACDDDGRDERGLTVRCVEEGSLRWLPLPALLVGPLRGPFLSVIAQGSNVRERGFEFHVGGTKPMTERMPGAKSAGADARASRKLQYVLRSENGMDPNELRWLGSSRKSDGCELGWKAKTSSQHQTAEERKWIGEVARARGVCRMQKCRCCTALDHKALQDCHFQREGHGCAMTANATAANSTNQSARDCCAANGEWVRRNGRCNSPKGDRLDAKRAEVSKGSWRKLF